MDMAVSYLVVVNLLHVFLDFGQLRHRTGQSRVLLVAAQNGQRPTHVTSADRKVLAVKKENLNFNFFKQKNMGEQNSMQPLKSHILDLRVLKRLICLKFTLNKKLKSFRFVQFLFY
jgi:hypothetical protein